MKIGVQGIPGSFSEQAGKKYATREAIDQYQLHYLVSSENVLSALDHKKIQVGIIAIENSTGGLVLESIHALARYRCEIADIFALDVRQNLLVRKGVINEQVTAIYSHRQALRQCSKYLAKHFPNCDLIETADTAQSAQDLHAGKLPSSAAVIVNIACVDIYALDVLAADIHDLSDNHTRFLAVKNI